MDEKKLIDFLKKNLNVYVERKDTSVTNGFIVSIYFKGTKVCESNRFVTDYCDDDFI